MRLSPRSNTWLLWCPIHWILEHWRHQSVFTVRKETKLSRILQPWKRWQLKGGKNMTHLEYLRVLEILIFLDIIKPSDYLTKLSLSNLKWTKAIPSSYNNKNIVELTSTGFTEHKQMHKRDLTSLCNVQHWWILKPMIQKVAPDPDDVWRNFSHPASFLTLFFPIFYWSKLELWHKTTALTVHTV